MDDRPYNMNKDKIILGIAPIDWTNDVDTTLGWDIPFEQCVSEMALAGFKGCEIGVKFPRDPEVLHRYLDIRGLQVVNFWTTLKLVQEDFSWSENMIRTNGALLKAMGAKVIGVCDCSCRPRLGGSYKPNGRHIMNDEEWATVLDGLNKLGKIALEEYGLKLVYHHHAGTSIETPEEIDRLMEGTDPKYVSLLWDTGHLDVLGFDPAPVGKKWMHRIGHIHLKSVRKDVLKLINDEDIPLRCSVPLGVYTVPGDGDSDFTEVFKIIRESDYEGVILVEAEQDAKQANPFEMAVLTRKFIKENLGI